MQSATLFLSYVTKRCSDSRPVIRYVFIPIIMTAAGIQTLLPTTDHELTVLSISIFGVEYC